MMEGGLGMDLTLLVSLAIIPAVLVMLALCLKVKMLPPPTPVLHCMRSLEREGQIYLLTCYTWCVVLVGHM